jgi:hypothetical protein
VSLRVNSIPTLRRGTTFCVRFNDLERHAALYIYARSNDAQANVRSARIRNNQTSAATTNVLGAPVWRGKRVKVDLPIGSDPHDAYSFIDCTSGIIGVEVVSPSGFVTQLRG